jgi:hypothetical protein
MVSPMTARFTALLVTLALAVPAAALGQVVHRCLMAGLVIGACCCSHQPEGGDGPAVDADACCDTKATTAAPAPVAPHPAPPVVALPADLPAPVAVPPPLPTLATRPRVLAAVGARAPPPLHGRGIYLEVCAFLI